MAGDLFVQIMIMKLEVEMLRFLATKKVWGNRLFHKYKYDADNRLIQVQTSTNARKFGYVTDARYYYYPHWAPLPEQN